MHPFKLQPNRPFYKFFMNKSFSNAASQIHFSTMGFYQLTNFPILLNIEQHTNFWSPFFIPFLTLAHSNRWSDHQLTCFLRVRSECRWFWQNEFFHEWSFSDILMFLTWAGVEPGPPWAWAWQMVALIPLCHVTPRDFSYFSNFSIFWISDITLLIRFLNLNFDKLSFHRNLFHPFCFLNFVIKFWNTYRNWTIVSMTQKISSYRPRAFMIGSKRMIKISKTF